MQMHKLPAWGHITTGPHSQPPSATAESQPTNRQAYWNQLPTTCIHGQASPATCPLCQQFRFKQHTFRWMVEPVFDWLGNASVTAALAASSNSHAACTAKNHLLRGGRFWGACVCEGGAITYLGASRHNRVTSFAKDLPAAPHISPDLITSCAFSTSASSPCSISPWACLHHVSQPHACA